jgi:hypothetical protein
MVFLTAMKKYRYLRQHHLDINNKARRLSQVVSEHKKGNIMPKEVSLLHMFDVWFPCSNATNSPNT